jgi:hypothetical protein
MRTFLFRKGDQSEAVKAFDTQGAWEALAKIVGDTTGWELYGAQG